MTYHPTTPGAFLALEALQARPKRGLVDDGIGLWDRAALREVLIAAVCPAPCTGQTDTDGRGWHAACERAADEALAALDRDHRPPAWGLSPPHDPPRAGELAAP